MGIQSDGSRPAQPTFHRWRNAFGDEFRGMDVADVRRLEKLESENGRLKRPIAGQMRVVDDLEAFG